MIRLVSFFVIATLGGAFYSHLPLKKLSYFNALNFELENLHRKVEFLQQSLRLEDSEYSISKVLIRSCGYNLVTFGNNF